MVDICITRQDGIYKELVFSGHAGFDDKGKDIVCAAVSVLFINTVNSIEMFTEDDISIEKKKDIIRASFSGSLSEKSTVLLDALLLGIRGIIDSYGEKYVSLSLID